MEPTNTKYALLRQGSDWEGVTTHFLEQDEDGALTLARLPGPADGNPVDLPGPYDIGASGIALGACGDLFISDTAHNRVLFIDRLCSQKAEVGGTGGAGQLNAPRGLVVGPPGGLYVADSGNGRTLVYRFPALESSFAWSSPLLEPVCIASDSRDRIYILDRGRKRVFRFDSWGVPDDDWNMAMAAPAGLASPAFLIVGQSDTLFVTDDSMNAIFRFDEDGVPLGPLLVAALPALQPRCIVAYANRLYVGDADSGLIRVLRPDTGEYLGDVYGYRGPVTAMAVDTNGDLYIKPGMDDQYCVFPASMAYTTTGWLEAGPLDAGILTDWNRLAVDIDLPVGTLASLEVVTSDTAQATTPLIGWETVGLDSLVPPVTWPFAGPRPIKRFLWLRLTLTTKSVTASPVVRQIHAETPGQSYMDLLPATYRRADEPDAFLRRFLEMLRSELGDLELEIDAMPGRFRPELSPAQDLPWLAGWLALNLPLGLAVEERRKLIGRAFELYALRGTPEGVREFVDIYTGVRPQIVEGWQERRIWQLGVTSALGFDTALPSADPNGIVIPDPGILDKPIPPYGCEVDSGSRMVVGQAIVGGMEPLTNDQIGLPLFDEDAHRFTVFVPSSAAPDEALRDEIRRVIDVEKPAHTDYHLCFVQPRMRVGLQARIGVDSIVAGPPEPMSLTGAELGVSAYLGGEDTPRMGGQIVLGDNTVLG